MAENLLYFYVKCIGEDADRTFLRKISLRNEGFMRHIYEAADAALQLRDFYQQVSSPLLSNVHFNYPKDQVRQLFHIITFYLPIASLALVTWIFIALLDFSHPFFSIPLTNNARSSWLSGYLNKA